MNISKITSRESLKKLIRKELYDHSLGIPIQKCGALSSGAAESLLLRVFDKAQELINKPVTTTNEQPLECPYDGNHKCTYPYCGCRWVGGIV